jgi:exonuclease 3'-5' domain-containing protein 1
LLRYVELTEDEKNKLRGSYKVARKLEKLEGAGADRSYSDDDEDEEESEDFTGDFTGDFPSLDSTCSGHTSPDASITLINGNEIINAIKTTLIGSRF